MLILLKIYIYNLQYIIYKLVYMEAQYIFVEWMKGLSGLFEVGISR